MSTTTNGTLAKRVCQLIEQHLEEPLTLDDLAGAVGVSPSHLQRAFKKAVGVSPRQYAEARRMERLKGRLREQASVTTAMMEAGYGSSSRLYEKADGQLGMTPGMYRRGGHAASIRYTVVACPLGRLLLAATERGVCAVYFGDDDATLETELAREFHAAARSRDDEGLREWASRALTVLGGGEDDLPLDVKATAFQFRVWQELRKVPRGQTRTYHELAKALGQPTAARAVARACATNPVSLLVPCHRIVRGDGGLGGYRWGLHRKRALLDGEAGATTEAPSGP
jgi:AraC family transcriptional regulator of adaptative response/methylated-DNA-[protein]-cysteine methyltransferase